MKSVTITSGTYERIVVRTHLVKFNEKLTSLVEQYIKKEWREGDWLAISEKVVSVSQNNVRHIGTVRAGWLAKLIVKGVKKYPNDIGFSLPEKMQVAVELTGQPRMILAVILGVLGKIVGLTGIFWRVAGHRISEIDGFNPDAMYPYTEYAILPPKEPYLVCQSIEDHCGIPTSIIDGNNINVEVIAMSKKMPLTKEEARLVLLDNPMGQDDEMTPFVIVRKAH